MKNPFKLLRKAAQVITRRVKDQGMRVTAIWLYGRGLPAVTGIPLLSFSRVTPVLFVGPQFRRAGIEAMRKAGITGVVNMRIEHDDRQDGVEAFHYCHLPVVDDTAPEVDQLRQGIQFIRDELENGGKVYIHCGAGVGRAPTMAAAYLISTGHSLDSALTLIRRVRPFIYVMPPQMERLREFEALHRPA